MGDLANSLSDSMKLFEIRRSDSNSRFFRFVSFYPGFELKKKTKKNNKKT